MRSPLTEIYQKVNSLAEQVHALPEDEKNYLLDLLLPQPEPEVKPAKKARKKSASKKSSRASSLEQQIQRRGRRTAEDDDNGRCGQCDMTADMPIHDPNGGYISHHPFSLAAPTASDRSSANGGAGGGIQNLETRVKDAGNVVHEASAAGGD